MPEDLSIISVVFGEAQYWRANLDLTRRLNPGGGFHWFVVDNSDPRVLAGSHGADVTVLDGVPRPVSRDLGSAHHAMAIHRAFQQVRTRYVLILDHDFYVVAANWIETLLVHARRNGLAFFGAPWHPRWHYQYRGFPAVHFMLVDLEQAPLATLDFSPAIHTDRYWQLINNHRLPLPAWVRNWLKSERLRDTGFRVKQRHGDARIELLQPVVGAAGANAGPEGFIVRLSPQAAGVGWEAFCWQDRPFGFHLRQVGRRMARDTTSVDAALLEEVLGRLKDGLHV